MKKLLAIIIMCMPLYLFAAVLPFSYSLGQVQGRVEPDSATALMLEAFQSEYTDAWLEMYAGSDELFALAYTPVLSSLLPMHNLISSLDQNGCLTLYCLTTGDSVAIQYEDNIIKALSFKLKDPPADSEGV